MVRILQPNYQYHLGMQQQALRRICRTVNELKSNKSLGPDNLSPKLLKLVEDDIVPSMYRLFNTSIESESLYSSWKIVKLIPIFKKDDVTEIKIIGQYRYSVLRAKS